MRESRGQGQAWSMDLIIGVLIFMLSIGVIYSLLNSQAEEDIAPLRIESEVVATKLTTDQSLKVAENNQLNMQKLQTLAEISEVNYTRLQRELGIENEFCIYLQNDEGKLIYIRGPGGKKYTGIGSGSSDVNISDVPCGQPCTLGADDKCT